MSMLKPSGLKAPSKTIKHGSTLLKTPTSVAAGKASLNNFSVTHPVTKSTLKAMSTHYFYCYTKVFLLVFLTKIMCTACKKFKVTNWM